LLFLSPAPGLTPQHQYNQTSGGGSGACDGWIGGGNCSGSDDESSWGVQCDADDCYAWVQCANGNLLSCHGALSGQADSTGVLCKDTGSDYGDWAAC
jgi:hypothetical protein